jgi:hypothetical protein
MTARRGAFATPHRDAEALFGDVQRLGRVSRRPPDDK